MKESFLKLLISGNFSEADELVKDMNISELGTFLIDIICKEKDYFPEYTYLNYKMKNASESELYELHIFACSMLITFFDNASGVYSSALYHAKSALKLKPNSRKALEMLLILAKDKTLLLSKDEIKEYTERLAKIK
ncbi:MAG: hypothetical protein IJJ82_00450 [Clostridia bacterium]|nr:hypothetical protein [Clostridia bacterium]